MVMRGKIGDARLHPPVKPRREPHKSRRRNGRLTEEEQDLLDRPAEGSWMQDSIRAGRDGGNFMHPPEPETLELQARRRKLAKAGRPVIRVTLPEPTKPLTPEQEAELAEFDRIRKAIGKVGFSVAGLIRELRGR